MEESKQMLDQGAGVPFVTMFDGNRRPFIDKKSQLPIGMLVTFFTYEYDEEDGDKAEIVIETDNVDLLDQPEFGDKMPIILQWGHILPSGAMKVSPTRKLIIRDVEWDGTDNGVRITLRCQDLLSLLKSQSAARGNTDFEDWLANVLSGVPEAKVIDYKLQGRLDIGNTSATFNIEK